MAVSSSTVSLFASVALAMSGASFLAYTLKHPGELRSLARTLIEPPAKTPSVSGTAAVGTQSDLAQAEPKDPDDGNVVLRAGDYGHFETAADVNGRGVDVMVDTGATLVALTYEDAERAGIFLKPSDFTHAVQTANGLARIAPVEIGSISIGDITVRNVAGAVSEPGKLHRTLLGMSFLGRLSRVDMRTNTLVLHQ